MLYRKGLIVKTHIKRTKRGVKVIKLHYRGGIMVTKKSP
jgi:hypothetical protein